MLAQKNIHTFHNSQRFEGKKVQTVSGCNFVGEKAVAIEKVGLVYSRRHGAFYFLPY